MESQIILKPIFSLSVILFSPKYSFWKTKPFFDDVKKCFNQGIYIIEDSAGFVYTILLEGAVEHFYLPDDEEDICLHCENKELIMNHINRILQADAVSKKDADVLLKLAHLAKILDGVE